MSGRKPERPSAAADDGPRRWYLIEKEGEKPRQTQAPADYEGWTIVAELERPLARHERLVDGQVVEDPEAKRRDELERRANRLSRAGLVEWIERLEARIAALEGPGE